MVEFVISGNVWFILCNDSKCCIGEKKAVGIYTIYLYTARFVIDFNVHFY